MPDGEEEKVDISKLDIPEYTPTQDVDLGGITIPDYNPDQDVQLQDFPPQQTEVDEFNNLLNKQLLDVNESFAAPETTVPRIDKITPESIEQGEEIFRQQNQENINFFNEFNAEKADRVEVDEPIADIISIDKSLTESVEGLLFGEDIKDHRTFAVEHIKKFDPERFKALQERSDEGKFREEDEISLVNEGIKLKAQALRLIFDEKEAQVREQADQLVGS